MKLLFLKIPRAIWKALTLLRQMIGNLIVLGALVLMIMLLFGDNSPPIPDKCALVLNLEGDLVEQKSAVAPLDIVMNHADGLLDQPETRLQDILEVIAWAAEDRRIQALVLDSSGLKSGGFAKLQTIGQALQKFKKSGKPVVAAGDHYNQRQYYLAAYADTVHLNPMGGVLLSGFGVYRQYFKQALTKLKIDVHVFRVGSFKSALEPFIRDNMSDAAKQANAEWTQALWKVYTEDIARQRGISTDAVDNYIEAFDRHLADEKGDMATVALRTGLVDRLSARDQVRAQLIELVGEDAQKKGHYRRIRFDQYLQVRRQLEHQKSSKKDRIGVIVAQGIILDGKQPPGKVGADSMTELIRDAIHDPRIKALVVRIDSGGGSAFASEAIRRELKRFRQTGRPVVASMGSVAASGGYWIAMAADRVWAQPTTLTGSIGIFGAFATLDRLIDQLGIHTDGVGTTSLTNALDPTRPLNNSVERAVQQMINHGYHRFIEVVAQGRKMDREVVEKSAQGRVWTGVQAHQRGLVDDLGDLDQALNAAAELAGVSAYERYYLRSEPSSLERWLGDLTLRVGRYFKISPRSSDGVGNVIQWIDAIQQQTTLLSEGNDPQGIYARCLPCEQAY